MYQDNLTWQQLTIPQRVQVAIDCSDWEIEQWELEHGSFIIERGIVIFASETMH